MKTLYLFLITLLILNSCKEEKKSRLDFGMLGVKEKHVEPKEDSHNEKSIGEKENPEQPLEYWDEFNTEQLKAKNPIETEDVLKLTRDSFEFNYTLDSNIDYENNLSNHNLRFVGTIKNKTNHSIFFLSSTCTGIGHFLLFSGNSHFNPIISCNMSWTIIEVIEPNSSINFRSTISILNKEKEIDIDFEMILVSKEVDITNLFPVKTIYLNTLPKQIPEKLMYVLDTNFRVE